MFGIGSKQPEAPKATPSSGWLSRLRTGLQRTRAALAEGLATLFLGKKTIDADLFDDLETRLLQADVGTAVTQRLIEQLTAQVERKALTDPQALFAALRQGLLAILEPCAVPLVIGEQQPFVLLVIGVNGAGKTTTIGKMAHYYQTQGQRVLLAAGDTFRAAAVEQLQVWGTRNQIPVIAQAQGADSAAVIFDAIQAGRSRHCTLVIADTAGRLHNRTNLMEELRKVKRVIHKADPSAPHEVLLVLDASSGQNALTQAEQFQQAIGVTGLALTKLDGTAKGGIIFAIADKLKLPVRFIGVGEGLEDLRPFDAASFVSALLDRD
jgi:fused signal recognition particle receptor